MPVLINTKYTKNTGKNYRESAPMIIWPRAVSLYGHCQRPQNGYHILPGVVRIKSSFRGTGFEWYACGHRGHRGHYCMAFLLYHTDRGEDLISTYHFNCTIEDREDIVLFGISIRYRGTHSIFRTPYSLYICRDLVKKIQFGRLLVRRSVVFSSEYLLRAFIG